MKHLALAVSLLALAACGGPKKEAPVETPVAETPPAETLLLPLPTETTADITARDLAERVKALADDTFEGRGPGTPIGEAAAA